MMDTSVLPNETNALHLELSKASNKQDKLFDRAMASAGFGATVEGMAIAKTYLGQVTQALTEKLSGPRPKSNTFDFKLERLLRQLDPELLALCLLQAGLHHGAKGGASQVSVCEAIGRHMNDELWAAKLLQTDAKLARKITKKSEERFSSVNLRKDHAKRLAEAAGFTMQAWSPEMMVRAGNWGMGVLLQAVPLVFQLEEARGRDQRRWSITELGMDMAKAALAEMVCLSPVYQPRTERPKDWDRFVMRVAEDDRTLDRAQLMRTRYKDVMSAVSQAIRTGQMAPAVRAVNALQSVPFTINTWIMDVMTNCYNNNITVDGLPSWGRLQVPKKLPAAKWMELSVEERRLLSNTRRGLMKANSTNDADVMSFEEDMLIAGRLALADQFYTPMNMDWRSRVYSLTQFNFQREDRVRALFLFANGEPIGEDGIYWLKLHVSNCGAFKGEDEIGIDKKPFEERIKWVDDNMVLITDYVKRPLHNTGWTKADAPFLFLAACKELVSALQSGPHYVCHLPVSWDGSCNGLQHILYAARASEGRHVNLTDCETPEDVYQLVAELTKSTIEADIGNPELFVKVSEDRPAPKVNMTYDRLANLCLAYGVDRKLVKRNVLTFGYSSKEYGMSEQHFEDTMAPLEMKLLKGEIKTHPFGDDEDEWRLVCRYLAKRTLAAIKSVLPAAAEAMAFMQTLAKKLAHEGKPLRWTTPAGVPCVNRYHDVVTERIKLFCYSQGVKSMSTVTVAVGHDTPIAKEKAAAGIAANHTHSNDAAHLLLTSAACADEGIALATVHDSFGCLPSKARRVNEILREQFLKMYSDHDVLAELLESARADLTNPDVLPPLPAKGELDPTEILNARYAFA